MEKKSNPLVSIGLPVYNGEKTIAQAIDNLLKQDYSNLEIIISNNGSTDRTAEICGEVIKKDSRLKYFHSDENRGSYWNFNRVFYLSSGKYFMWAAHDDMRESSFVSVCVKKLEQFPEAALCHPFTEMFVENREKRLCVTNLNSFEGVTDLVKRYQQTLKHFPAVAIYGIYRSSTVKKTHMLEHLIASDLSFVQELSIYGSFIQVPEKLFTYINREKWNTVHDDYKNFSGKDRKPWWYFPFIVLFCNHWSRVIRAELPLMIKLRLWYILTEHELKQVILKIFFKLCGCICPRAWKEDLACAIYIRWKKSPNVEVGCKDLFLERVIKPSLGWWR